VAFYFGVSTGAKEVYNTWVTFSLWPAFEKVKKRLRCTNDIGVCGVARRTAAILSQSPGQAKSA
jgi:hypothetical protein